MRPREHEIKRRLRVLEHAEKIGNVRMTCRLTVQPVDGIDVTLMEIGSPSLRALLGAATSLKHVK